MNMQESRINLTRRRLLGNIAALAVTATGVSALGKRAIAKGAGWDKRFELAVDFTINEPEGGRYHRPFVAVWIEDADTAAVRTLSIWVQKTGKGPRWHKDLKRWFRDEKERRVINGGDLIKSVSGATRPPGTYSLVWDGRDDDGKLVEQGNYILCIEAAREHGTYQLIKSELNIGSSPFSKSLGGNVEIKGASVAYRRK